MSTAKLFGRPSPHQPWLGPPQRAALTHLLQGAALKVLSGPPSSGKTVLLDHVHSVLAQRAVVLRCNGPKADARAVLSALLTDAELGSWLLGETDQRNLLAVFIRQRRAEDQRVVVILDDIHCFGPVAWEELERLRRFRLDGAPAVELLLAGRAEGPVRGACAQLAARPGVGVMLEAPAPADVVDYIDWRFRQQGLPNPFRPVALRLIARLSGRRYAAVDTLCRMSMILMHQRGNEHVDARLVHDAVAALVQRRRERFRNVVMPHPEVEVVARAAGSRR